MEKNVQEAPFPVALSELVQQLVLEPDWNVYLVDEDRGQGSKGLTLNIVVQVYDTYHPENGRNYRVRHLFPVPAASYDRRSWQRWLLERYFDVVKHEACEFFQIDGQRPYAPHHGPGEDPYVVFEVGTAEAQKTRAV